MGRHLRRRDIDVKGFGCDKKETSLKKRHMRCGRGSSWKGRKGAGGRCLAPLTILFAYFLAHRATGLMTHDGKIALASSAPHFSLPDRSSAFSRPLFVRWWWKNFTTAAVLVFFSSPCFGLFILIWFLFFFLCFLASKRFRCAANSIKVSPRTRSSSSFWQFGIYAHTQAHMPYAIRHTPHATCLSKWPEMPARVATVTNALHLMRRRLGLVADFSWKLKLHAKVLFCVLCPVLLVIPTTGAAARSTPRMLINYFICFINHKIGMPHDHPPLSEHPPTLAALKCTLSPAHTAYDKC